MKDILSSIEFRPAYNDDGSRSWARKEFHKQPGVYVISYRGEIAYVGRSGGSVYQACYRHFEPSLKKMLTGYNGAQKNKDWWYDRNDSEVWMYVLPDKQDSIIVEKALVLELKPLHNRRRWDLEREEAKKSIFREPAREAFSEDYEILSLYEEGEHLRVI